MRVFILGSAAALPDPDRCHGAVLITVRERHYLFDCGHGATLQIVRANVNPAIVNTVFFSHLHFDHIADFPFFMMSTWICNREVAPTVIGPVGTKNFVDHLFMEGAYEADIRARTQYPRRKANLHVLKPDIRECEPGIVFEDDLIQVNAFYAEHIPREISPCFGFRIEDVDGKSVLYSGDTKHCEALEEHARGVDLLIHECTFPKKAIEFRKKAGVGLWAHTPPAELGALAQRVGAKRLVATHFGNFDTTNPVVKEYLGIHMPIEMAGPDLLDEVAADILSTYKGDLRLAHDLMRIDL